MRKVVVTGANSGIGLGCVKFFLEQGNAVVALYHKDDGNLKILEENFPKLTIVPVDLEMLHTLDEKYHCEISDADVLINNAASYSVTDPIEKIPLDVLHHTMQVNLDAPLLLTQWVFEGMMKKQKGHIVNISSIGIKYGGSITTPSYTLSKYALEELTALFAKRGSEHNILVNTLRLGVINTELHLRSNKNMQERIAMIPLKRMIEIDEVVRAVDFLTSEANRSMTNSVLTLAGGE